VSSRRPQGCAQGAAGALARVVVPPLSIRPSMSAQTAGWSNVDQFLALQQPCVSVRQGVPGSALSPAWGREGAAPKGAAPGCRTLCLVSCWIFQAGTRFWGFIPPKIVLRRKNCLSASLRSASWVLEDFAGWLLAWHSRSAGTVRLCRAKGAFVSPLPCACSGARRDAGVGGLVILGQNPPFPHVHEAAWPCFASKFLLLVYGCEPRWESEFGVLLLTFNPCFWQGRAAAVIS